MEKTGQKQPIVILSKLGHSVSYEKVLEIETTQAEVAEQFQSNSSVLPIQPVLESTKVTIFLKLAYQEIKFIITYYVFPLHQGYIL